MFFCCLLLVASMVNGQIVKVGYHAPKYQPLSNASIRPTGWLAAQLQHMRQGTSGHLDEMYGKVANDNGWLGGKGDGWEETPYWLDGAVPLAWLLNDDTLKAKVMRYINWTLDHQRPSGYFGPVTQAERTGKGAPDAANPEKGDDWWPKMVFLKVLQQYYLFTNDQRVPRFMQRYFDYQLAVLKKCPLNKWTEWAEARGMDNAMMVLWLYSINRQPKLLQLAALLEQQTFPWTRLFGEKEWIVATTTYSNAQQLMNRHAVNVAMGLKAPLAAYLRTGDTTALLALKTGFTDLMRVHGLPTGVFSGDEDLSGNAPTQGTELCAIVEAMYSLENAAAVTGDTYWMDAVDKMAFNALAAQTTTDYNNKQYFQVANQVQISRGVFDFTLPFHRQMCNVLGMRSGYTCCLANMHQGWTKYATSLWMQTAGRGIAATGYGPNELQTRLGTAQLPVKITEETSYPFGESVQFTISCPKPVDFSLQLRIPGWCKEGVIAINGTVYKSSPGGKMIAIQRQWKTGDVVTLQLPMHTKIATWGMNSRAIERGPLVYALKVAEKWEEGTDEAEGPYWSVYPASAWNYGLLKKEVDAPGSLQFKQLRQPDSSFAFDQAHATGAILLSGRQIPGWKAVSGVAHQPVNDRTGVYRGEVDKAVQPIELVPLGFTKSRIVAFPVVE